MSVYYLINNSKIIRGPDIDMGCGGSQGLGCNYWRAATRPVAARTLRGGLVAKRRAHPYLVQPARRYCAGVGCH
jgi:hypothetical protein